eukprot:TRINITY_DN4721_c0_g1_i2.p1 TRINITY_DN4721_c0_g1~~TRINITY_DN4721_c0_g1_i2.p1  ORF type:complete len:182 (+),score=4.70 TRINITY_DN4721_c0_g1_i2:288-833(+)
MGSSPQSSPPCGACRFLRRKCAQSCVFAPYFASDQGQRFANVHKIFGASNVAKLLQEIPEESREDAVNSISYEADARVADPVYGCVGALFSLQQQVLHLQTELAMAQAEVARLHSMCLSTTTVPQQIQSSQLEQQQQAVLQQPAEQKLLLSRGVNPLVNSLSLCRPLAPTASLIHDYRCRE